MIALNKRMPLFTKDPLDIACTLKVITYSREHEHDIAKNEEVSN